MESEIGTLEQRLASLNAHARELRAANEQLRRELAVAQELNRALRERMQAAGSRIDAVLSRMPAE